MNKLAVILVGHGAPALDCPPYDVFKLRQLVARRKALGGGPSEEEIELERRIREFPRTAENDPYRAGIEALADALREKLGEGSEEEIEVAIAFSEFCSPTLGQAVAALVKGGVEKIVVVPSMMTPGGVHAERDLPEEIERIRGGFEGVDLVYAWPFDLAEVAGLLAGQVNKDLRRLAKETR